MTVPFFNASLASKKAALIVSHPGHELRIHKWCQLTKPRVFILTDGSGGQGTPRLAQSAQLLRNLGCEAGAIFGRFSDRELYKFFLKRDVSELTRLRDELSAELQKADIDYVVGDALEGYNSAHDFCRILIGAALENVKRTSGKHIANFSFCLASNPSVQDPEQSDFVRLKLNDEELEAKFKAAQAYDGLQDELAMALEKFGKAAFDVEVLQAVDNFVGTKALKNKPYYECYGEEQVAKGLYSEVIRHQQHLMPIANALLFETVKRESPHANFIDQ